MTEIEQLARKLAEIIVPMHVSPLRDMYFTQQTKDCQTLLLKFAEEIKRITLEE